MAVAFRVFLPFGCNAQCFSRRGSATAFFVPYRQNAAPTVRAKAKTLCVMQQTTIQFDQVLIAKQHSVDVTAPIRKAVQVVNNWLDSRSEFYSRILGQAISWRKALRVGVVLPLLMVAVVICGMMAPLVTVTSLTSAGWIVYRLNQQETGGRL